MSAITSNAVINHMKSISSEYGIPEVIMSDNGPQYSSKEFALFCEQWGITHITSSPTYAQSNGFAERMVQTVKNIMKKSDRSADDIYLGLLTYRTTPVDTKLPSPAYLLNTRVYRTLLPCSGRQQRSQTDNSTVEQLKHRQDIQCHQYNRGAKHLDGLKPQQPVSVYTPLKKSWAPAIISDVCDSPRSYIVTTPEGQSVRRNRNDIKPRTYDGTPKRLPEILPQKVLVTSDGNAEFQPPKLPVISNGNKVQVTRSGRFVKPPTRLDL
ncbi:Uncharacterised protein g3183 [Pycnogonum litorale]